MGKDDTMKTRTLLAAVVCSMAAGWLMQPVLAGWDKGDGQAALDPAETADLLFMREEEKLAHDVYVTLHAEWGVRAFDNISRSEQSHTDAVLGLLQKYGVANPALGFGEFADAGLQELFDTLVASGLVSKLDALMVGALIEEVDLEDIVAAMERTAKTDILTVYGNLLAGSENHLNAFVRNIEAITGAPYVAQHLPQEKVDGILGR